MKKPILLVALSTGFGVFMGALAYHNLDPKHTMRVELVPTHEPTRVEVVKPVLVPVETPRVVAPAPHTLDDDAENCDTPKSVELDSADVDSGLSSAQSHFVNGDYATSISVAKRFTRQSPVRAWRIIGAAACHCKDLKLINEAFRRIDAPGRQYLVYVCQREGVVNRRNQFHLSDD